MNLSTPVSPWPPGANGAVSIGGTLGAGHGGCCTCRSLAPKGSPGSRNPAPVKEKKIPL